MRTTSQRCVFCHKKFRKRVIKKALLGIWWRVLGPYDDDLYEDGSPMPSYLPREGEHWNTEWTPKLGWHHLSCRCAYGSGRTPEQQAAEMALSLHKDMWRRGKSSTAEYETIRERFLPFLHPNDLHHYRAGETE